MSWRAIDIDLFRRLVPWSDASESSRKVSAAQAHGLAREVVQLLERRGERPGSALAGIMGTWTEDHGDAHLLHARLVEALRDGRLLLEEEDRPATTHEPASHSAPPPMEAPRADSSEESVLSHYLCRLVDEHDVPIAAVDATMHTPAGKHEVVTNGDGLVRVDDVPSGFGHVRFSQPSLRTALAGREATPRRTTPWPDDEAVHIRSIRTARDTVTLPDAELQTVMVVTRTDVSQARHYLSPLELRSSDLGPCELEDDPGRVGLTLHADARGHTTVLRHPPPARFEVGPPPTAIPATDDAIFIAPNIYVVQPGDTLVRIAQRLLGDPSRWREIWALSKNDYPGRSPDVLFAGDQLRLPPDGVPTWLTSPLPPATAPLGDASAPPDSTFARVSIDDLHEALLNEHLGPALDFLETVDPDPKAEAPNLPPPFIEAVCYRATLAKMALEGRWDPPRTDDDYRQPALPEPGLEEVSG